MNMKKIREVEIDDCSGRCRYLGKKDMIRSGDFLVKEDGNDDWLMEVNEELIGHSASEFDQNQLMRVRTPSNYIIADWNDVVKDDFLVWQTWPTFCGRGFGWVRKNPKCFIDQRSVEKFGRIIAHLGPLARWFVCKPCSNNEVNIL